MVNKQGRPPLPDDERLKLRRVRVSDVDWLAWESAADRAGANLSEWMRAALNRAAARSKPGK